MSDWKLDEVARTARAAAEFGADEKVVHEVVTETFRREAILGSARKAAREESVVRDSLPLPCEVWRDPTRDEETFMVRFPWSGEGIPHTLEEFVRWFGPEAPDTIPGGRS